MVPKLHLPIFSMDNFLAGKISLGVPSKTNNEKKGEEMLFNEYLDCINASLDLCLEHNISLDKFKRALNEYREQKQFEYEDIYSLCMYYKDSLNINKEYMDHKVLLLTTELNSLQDEINKKEIQLLEKHRIDIENMKEEIEKNNIIIKEFKNNLESNNEIINKLSSENALLKKSIKEMSESNSNKHTTKLYVIGF